ncbi:hypothetical protein PENTCL1PPCAC_10040, partial [Pristionchus entomophagus]
MDDSSVINAYAVPSSPSPAIGDGLTVDKNEEVDGKSITPCFSMMNSTHRHATLLALLIIWAILTGCSITLGLLQSWSNAAYILPV